MGGLRDVAANELRCTHAQFHYGMGAQDPATRIMFHSKSSELARAFDVDSEAKPLRQKVLVFWNPPKQTSDDITVKRLTHAFEIWAKGYVQRHEDAALQKLAPKSVPREEVQVQVQRSLRRTLRIHAS